jgi:hypothetical protein
MIPGDIPTGFDGVKSYGYVWEPNSSSIWLQFLLWLYDVKPAHGDPRKFLSVSFFFFFSPFTVTSNATIRTSQTLSDSFAGDRPLFFHPLVLGSDATRRRQASACEPEVSQTFRSNSGRSGEIARGDNTIDLSTGYDNK